MDESANKVVIVFVTLMAFLLFTLLTCPWTNPPTNAVAPFQNQKPVTLERYPLMMSEARGKVCIDIRSFNDRGPTIAEAKSRDIERISVKGFDGHEDEDVKSALREHFASCGRITDINIRVGWRVTAHIYFVGKGAADKALKLDGSVVAAGGWKVCAEPYPFSEDRIDAVIIRGYDTSLSDSEIDVAVRDFLSSCGQVIDVGVSKRGSIVTYIKGFFAAEKALKLDGSYFKGRKVAVSVLTTPLRNHGRIRGRIPHPGCQ